MGRENEPPPTTPSKGFAGLSSMLSDVDDEIVPAADPVRPDPAPPATSTEPGSSDGKPPTPGYEGQSAESGSGGKWLIGIGAAFGSILLYGAFVSQEPTASPSPAAPYQPSTYAPTVEPTAPEAVANDVSTEIPPVGDNQVLWGPQIRYCLAEEIRISSAEAVVNSYNGLDVDRFNAKVNDYNSRCGSFRYRSGALESARADVERHRSELEAEGRREFQAVPVGALGTETPYVSAESTDAPLVADEPILPPTPMALSDEESQSLEAGCSSAKYLEGPAAYARCKDRRLEELANGVARPDLGRLTNDELQSIEAACSQDKFLRGPASYNACLTRQLTLLSGTSGRPDLSNLNVDGTESIESVCSQDMYMRGPAAYNRCLSAQLAALVAVERRVDLSGVPSADRESIQMACSQAKFMEGPTSYAECVATQLVEP